MSKLNIFTVEEEEMGHREERREKLRGPVYTLTKIVEIIDEWKI